MERPPCHLRQALDRKAIVDSQCLPDAPRCRSWAKEISRYPLKLNVVRKFLVVSCCAISTIRKVSDPNEETSSRIGGESSSSSIDDFSPNVPASKPSTFRSMLASGQTTRALTLKGRLRRLRKLEDTGVDLDSGGDRESTGRGLQRFRRGTPSRGAARPPVQHAESLSSDEGTRESSGGGTNIVSDDDAMSPALANGKGFVSSPEEKATSGSDEGSDNSKEVGRIDREKIARGDGVRFTTAKSRRSAGRPNFQASHLKKGLLRLARRRSRQPPAPRLPSPAESSSASSEREAGKEEEERDDEGGQRPGLASLTNSSTSAASLLDNNLGGDKTQPSRRAPRGGLWKRNRDGDNGKGRQRRLAGERVVSTGRGGGGGGGGSTARSSRTGFGRQQSMIPSRPRGKRGWGGWDSVDDAGEDEVAPVSGMGRPAAGAIENTLYGWFGGVIGRNWPGIGLAPGPAVDKQDAKEVRKCLVISRGVVSRGSEGTTWTSIS